MNTKKFASQADLEEKQISWEKLSDNAWAYTRSRAVRQLRRAKRKRSGSYCRRLWSPAIRRRHRL